MPVCSELVANGICHRPHCPDSHDVHRCETCRRLFPSLAELRQHEITPLHLRRVVQQERREAGQSRPVHCTICDVYLSAPSIYTQHSRGRRHINHLGDRKDPGPLEVDLLPGTQPCDICETIIPDYLWEKHLKGRRHAGALSYTTLESALVDTERDKNGVVVAGGESEIDFGVLEANTTRTHEYKVLIENTGASPTILQARLSSGLGNAPSHMYVDLLRCTRKT